MPSDQLRHALATDLTIDIVTTGARSGEMRTTEIWYTRVEGEIYITGTPSKHAGQGPLYPRDWLANLKANPEFVFRLKESVEADLPARAEIITDEAERRRLFAAPEAIWYVEQAGSIDYLVAEAPVVKVHFSS